MADGKPRLWLDTTALLDGATGGAISWLLALEDYLEFGDATQAYFTIEYYAAGPGATTTTLQLQRTSMHSDYDDGFENMLGTAITLAREHKVEKRAFGPDGGATDKYPRGLCRVKLANSGALENWCAVRMRIWVTLQNG